MLVLEQMAAFFVLVLVGFVANRRGIIDEVSERQLSMLLVDIACPAMILSSVADGAERMPGQEIAVALAAVALVFGSTLALANVLPMLLRYPQRERCAVNAMTTFTNMGFIGMPLLAGLYGNEALIYITLFLIPSNVIYYTYGIRTINGNNPATKRLHWRDCLSSGVLACVAAIVLYVAEVTMPRLAAEPIKLLGAVTAPLAMMLLGASLSQAAWHDLAKDWRLPAFIIIRMILFPVLVLLILEQFVDDHRLLGACLVVLATPIGNMVAMLAALYDREVLPLIVRGTSLTTAASVLTVPLVAYLVGLG